MSSIYLILAIVIFMLALSLFLFALAGHYRKRELVHSKLDVLPDSHINQDQTVDDSPSARDRRFLDVFSSVPMEQEIQLLLRQAGYPGAYARLVFTFINIALPVLVLIIGAPIVGLALEPQLTTGALFLVIAVILGFLVPRWMLRYIAARRARALAEETPVVMQLLMMLMETGMSIEQAFRVLLNESRHQGKINLLPEFSKELTLLLTRLDAGGSLAYELNQMAESLQIEELSDMTAVLRQAMQRGGNVRDSLTALLELMDDRRQIRLQELAGKISGKMSIVMMAFIFPALLVFTAGPGLLALLEALREISS